MILHIIDVQVKHSKTLMNVLYTYSVLFGARILEQLLAIPGYFTKSSYPHLRININFGLEFNNRYLI